jgi:hypothetical protein
MKRWRCIHIDVYKGKSLKENGEHTKTTTKYAAWFSGHGVVCPLFADVTFWNTQPIKTLMDWIKNKYYTMCEYISNASSFCCHFLLNFFLCVRDDSLCDSSTK